MASSIPSTSGHSTDAVTASVPRVPLSSSTIPTALKGSWNLRRILGVLATCESAIDWCHEVGLLPKTRKCLKNGKEWMSIVGSSRAHSDSVTAIGLRFRCKKYNVSKTICENTWFERHKILMEDVILLTYFFATKRSFEDARKELQSFDEQIVSDETIVDVYSYSREVCMLTLDWLSVNQGPLGGPDKIVEIDEMKFGKRKYERGRIVEGTWIFGAIQTDTREFRLEICPENRRSSEALLPLIKKHILPGTTIYSDCWRAYDCLKDHSYNHLNVNHEEHFVDPETGVNTQIIESQWRPLRARLQRGGISRDDIDYHLCEYFWRREIKKEGLDSFAALIMSIIRIYPGADQ